MEGGKEALPSLCRGDTYGKGDGHEPAQPDEEHTIAEPAVEDARGAMDPLHL